MSSSDLVMQGNVPAGPQLPSSGRFRPLALLGEGSMGVVWRVQDLETDSEVALKTFRAASPDDVYHLKNEFRVLADLAHTNLCELYELFLDERSAVFTMEFVDGVDFVRRFSGAETGTGALAAATLQLADGVSKLHATGRMHRDIKPSNVLVDREGRVVLLDFGLATFFGRERRSADAEAISGTWAYMAPEILRGAAATPDADWYSIGALLFETFTGLTPFECLQLRRDPLRDGAPDGRRAPAEFVEALSLLLHDDPAQRRGGIDVLARLAGRGTRLAGRATSTVFVGRQQELAKLRALGEEVDGGSGRVVHLFGPSGIGKSELLRRFARERETQHENTVVLSGRCHPQESVPYKAFDSIVDSLSRLLVEQSGLAAEVQPDDAGALRRLFPVLERVEGFGEDAAAAIGDPVELRRRGFAAFRMLLAKLGQAVPSMLWIDDLQWSDADSLLLLRELFRPPLPQLLVVLSWRSEDAAAMPVLQRLSDSEFADPALRLELGPLPAADSATLLRGLSSAAASSGFDVSGMLSEANGNPFFLSELARSVEEGCESPRIGDLVGDRLVELPELARRLLETVSVAGGPVSRSVALTASGIGERGRALASHLEKRSLLRTTVLDQKVGLEIYHDRIRETLLGVLGADTKRGHHAALADVLVLEGNPDAEALYRHSLGAERREAAGHWAEIAGDQAASSLAFERAAELFGAAIGLRASSRPAWPLMEKRAGALANGGRALEAARTYEEASRELLGAAASGDTSAERNAVRLREKAAMHYLQTGHLEEGLTVTQQVLRAVDIPFPKSQGRAIASALWQRMRLGRRGLDFQLRTEPLDEATRLRLDACWNAAISLTMVDQASADALGTRHMLESLDSGDSLQIIRALGGEASRSSQLAGRFMRRRCDRLAGRMEALVRSHGEAFQEAHLLSTRGMIAFQSSRWRLAHEHFHRSSGILRRDCIGVTWEMTTVQLFELSALAHMGRLRELSEQLPAAIGNAADRGDIYTSLLFHTGVMSFVWLARDEPEEALRVAEETMARWPAAQQFQVQHYVHLIATVNADLYRGDPWSAFKRMEGAWPRLKAALFLAFESARVELRNMRARAALAAAVAPVTARNATPPDSKWTREKLLAIAAGEARKLAKIENVVSAPAFALLLEAGIAAAREERARAADSYRNSWHRFEAIDMRFYAASAADRLRRTDDSARSIEYAERWADAEQVSAPGRLFDVASPTTPAR